MHILPNAKYNLGTTKKTKLVSFVSHHFYTRGTVHFLFFFFSSSADVNAHHIKKKFFLQTPYLTFSHSYFSFLLISVRNHTVHFVGQIVLNAGNRLTGSANYEVSSGALHVVQAHVTGFSNLTLGEAHKLRVPGVDAKTLGDQDLT